MTEQSATMRDPMDQELEDLRRFVDFVNLWIYRKCSANEEERLSVIKFHPVARKMAKMVGWIDADGVPVTTD